MAVVLMTVKLWKNSWAAGWRIHAMNEVGVITDLQSFAQSGSSMAYRIFVSGLSCTTDWKLRGAHGTTATTAAHTSRLMLLTGALRA
jgi:hypothetical protein